MTAKMRSPTEQEFRSRAIGIADGVARLLPGTASVTNARYNAALAQGAMIAAWGFSVGVARVSSVNAAVQSTLLSANRGSLIDVSRSLGALGASLNALADEVSPSPYETSLRAWASRCLVVFTEPVY